MLNLLKRGRRVLFLVLFVVAASGAHTWRPWVLERGVVVGSWVGRRHGKGRAGQFIKRESTDAFFRLKSETGAQLEIIIME